MEVADQFLDHERGWHEQRFELEWGGNDAADFLGGEQLRPFRARSRRRVFLLGRANPEPKRTGRSIRPLSRAYLNTTRMRWIAFPRATGPQRAASLLRSAAKLSGSRSATRRPLPNWLTIRTQAALYSFQERFVSSPDRDGAWQACRKWRAW